MKEIEKVKLKYYFRGIGIGILVTTLIFMCAITAKGGIMTDERAVSRAEELGYTKSGGSASGDAAYTDISSQLEEYKNRQQSSEDVSAKTKKQKDTEDDGDTDTEDAQDSDTAQTDTPQADVPEDADTVQDEQDVSTEKTVDLVVSSRMSSETVARRLEELGVIDNSSDFNSYLISHGYSTRLQNGTFTIPQDASFEEISQILMGQ
jgi:hypothetical protein